MYGSTVVWYRSHIKTICKVDGIIRNYGDPPHGVGTNSVIMFFVHEKHDLLNCSNSSLTVIITIIFLLNFLVFFLSFFFIVHNALDVALLMVVMARQIIILAF
jgi:hypothetical protein